MSHETYVTDFLNVERKVSANYDQMASECVSIPLRDTFLQMLEQSHHSQTELARLEEGQGGYGLATQEEIHQVYEQYAKDQPKAEPE